VYVTVTTIAVGREENFAIKCCIINYALFIHKCVDLFHTQPLILTSKRIVICCVQTVSYVA